jgi:Domain of unknown function (DUF4234)
MDTIGKHRNPWGVFALTLITLGIYHLFWYYYINREMANLGHRQGEDLGDSPGKSVLAITLGVLLIIPPFVSIWHTGKRMQRSGEIVGSDGGSGALYFVLSIFTGVFGSVYMQYQLNAVWSRLASTPLRETLA